MRISYDRILSKSFSDMSEIELQFAKLEISKVVDQLLSAPHSSDFKQGLALALLAGSVGSLERTSLFDDKPEKLAGTEELFNEIPEEDPFTEKDLFGAVFKEVELPEENVTPRETRSVEAKRKVSPGDTQFAAMVKELAGRTE